MPSYPNSAKFAFSIFDDTDLSTVDKIKPIYDLLLELGLLTTKSVWVFPTTDAQDRLAAQTLSTPEYLDFVRQLQSQGFEIAFHGAKAQSSTKEITLSALQEFRQLLGHYPNVHANHSFNRENLYWGSARLDCPLFRLLVRLGTRRPRGYFQGHQSGSPYFWGDVCQEHITYVRSFVFRDINLLRINPTLPYKDPRRPFVRYWFTSSEGADVTSFDRLLRLENQDKLEREGGVCIVYTHFGTDGFVRGDQVNPRTKELLTALSERQGWFVPVTTLLDHLRAQQRSVTLSPLERLRMETAWVTPKLIHGTT